MSGHQCVFFLGRLSPRPGPAVPLGLSQPGPVEGGYPRTLMSLRQVICVLGIGKAMNNSFQDQ